MAASTSDCSGCLTVSTICCTGFTAAATTRAAPPAAAPSVVHCSSEAFSNGFRPLNNGTLDSLQIKLRACSYGMAATQSLSHSNLDAGAAPSVHI